MADNSLIVRGGPLWAGPERFFSQGLVEIVKGSITYAGAADGYSVGEGAGLSTLEAEGAGLSTLEAGGGLIMPGLVNAHCHGAMTLFRGLADDLPLDTWLQEHMFPAEARFVNEDMTRLCTLLAAAEMILSGTTCVGDAYFCAEGMAQAYALAGMRAQVAQGVIDYPAPGIPDPQQNLAVARKFVESCKEVHPLVTPALFAHSPYTCSPRTLKGVAALAGELGVAWHTHLAETQGELSFIQDTYATTPLRHLEAAGVLASLQAGVHGVWLDDGELEILASAGTGLIHCPESNMKLASGPGRAADWLEAGIPLGLGTDGAAANNDLDMFGEMKSAALLAKITCLDPTRLPAPVVLAMATTGSACCLGLEKLVGELKPGMAGDLIVIDLDQPHLTPLFNPVSHLVYAARGGDVRHSVVQGRIIMQDRVLATMDIHEVMARVREMGQAVGLAN